MALLGELSFERMLYEGKGVGTFAIAGAAALLLLLAPVALPVAPLSAPAPVTALPFVLPEAPAAGLSAGDSLLFPLVMLPAAVLPVDCGCTGRPPGLSVVG